MSDPRDIPKLSYRPCDHCGHRHYFLTDEDDAEDCPMCGGELYPIAKIVLSATSNDLFHFVQHKPRCAALEVNWHKGPCDCGLSKLLRNVPALIRKQLGPGAVICTTCGDKKTLEDGHPCPNCKEQA